jgi:hypothetical protein
VRALTNDQPPNCGSLSGSLSQLLRLHGRLIFMPLSVGSVVCPIRRAISAIAELTGGEATCRR